MLATRESSQIRDITKTLNITQLKKSKFLKKKKNFPLDQLAFHDIKGQVGPEYIQLGHLNLVLMTKAWMDAGIISHAWTVAFVVCPFWLSSRSTLATFC